MKWPPNFLLYRKRLIVVLSMADGKQKFMACQRRRGRQPKNAAPGILGKVIGYAKSLEGAIELINREWDPAVRGWRLGQFGAKRGRPRKDGRAWMDVERPVPTTDAEWRALEVRT